jgi:hypothetical protein
LFEVVVRWLRAPFTIVVDGGAAVGGEEKGSTRESFETIWVCS